MVPFSFAQMEWRIVGTRALYWVAENALVVADLHLEKASFYAQTGQMLPPYDSRATLSALADALRTTGARRVFCLGDNFHDSTGPQRMEPHAAGMLDALTRAAEFVWITGNHDAEMPTLSAPLPGTTATQLAISGIWLRHRATSGATGPELSGHFHPRLRLTARGRRIARPCTVASENRLILPAFGSLTGGMDAADPVILAAMQPAQSVCALLAAGNKLVRYPLWPGIT